ncbi:MAG: helix-turn-helix transcriptional regulator [Paludibacteraceae bacterium]|nr:helix-turn-helix transcriptional regulator [Paludibacteraceae bacterium]
MLSLLISVPMLTSLFWLMWYAISYKHLESGRRMMTWFFIACFVLYLMHYLYFSGVESKITETIYGTVNLLVYPLFLFYLLRLTGNELSLEKLWLLPAPVLLTAYPVFYMLELDTAHYVIYIAARCCFAVQVAYTAIYGTMTIIRFRRSLDDQYSDDRSYSLRPLVWLVALFSVISLLSMLSNIIGREWFAGKSLVAVPAVTMSVLLYLLGYVTSRISFSDIEYNAVDGNRISVISDNNKANAQALVQLNAEYLEAMMQKKKPYLNPSITLSELAVMLHTNRTYLSVFLHDEMQMNFASYINMYRVEEAKKILADSSYTSSKEAVHEAIFKSGFAVESTFYRIFKQYTGMPPIEWRKEKLLSVK